MAAVLSPNTAAWLMFAPHHASLNLDLSISSMRTKHSECACCELKWLARCPFLVATKKVSPPPRAGEAPRTSQSDGGTNETKVDGNFVNPGARCTTNCEHTAVCWAHLNFKWDLSKFYFVHLPCRVLNWIVECVTNSQRPRRWKGTVFTQSCKFCCI